MHFFTFSPFKLYYTRQKKFCTLGSFGEFYPNLEWMRLMLYIVVYREIILQQIVEFKTEKPWLTKEILRFWRV